MAASARKQRAVQVVLWVNGFFYLGLAALMIGAVVLGAQQGATGGPTAINAIAGRGIGGIAVSLIVGIFTIIAAWKGRKHRGYPAVVIVINVVLTLFFIVECVFAGLALANCPDNTRYLSELCDDSLKVYVLALIGISLLVSLFGIWAGAALLKVTKPDSSISDSKYVYMEESEY